MGLVALFIWGALSFLLALAVLTAVDSLSAYPYYW